MSSLRHLVSLAIVVPAIASAASGAGLLSIEEARQLSEATGRPILAMAGSKT
jgi:hypothetical protein